MVVITRFCGDFIAATFVAGRIIFDLILHLKFMTAIRDA
jgi:hypothetical protein